MESGTYSWCNLYSIPYFGLSLFRKFNIWILDFGSLIPKEKYSMKEGYKVEIGCYEALSHCATPKATSWWKHLWTMAIPPKVRVFGWRVLHNIIRTSENLLSHHVPVLGNCPLCKFGQDSTCHALFWCNLVKPCWKETNFWPLLKQVSHLCITDVYLWMKGVLNRTDFEAFAIRTCATWHERLNSLHGKDRRPTRILSTDWSVSVLREFQHAFRSIYSRDGPISSNAMALWAAPPHN